MPAGRSDAKPCRVLLVDDSDTYRTALASMLGRDKSIQIVGEAADGKTALELTMRLHPDVLLMDVMMPRMDGIETARAVLHSSATAIVLMSIIVRYPEHRSAFSELPKGSVDFTDKPVLVGPAGEANVAALIRRLKAAQENHSRRQEGAPSQGPPPASCQLIAIAASTGGLEATQHIMGRLQPGFPPIVIAQHVDPEFAGRFALLLQNTLHRPVTAVKDREPLRPGSLYVAAHHHHIKVLPGIVFCLPAEAGELAPSCDQLFLSVAKWYGSSAVGVILTGMGHDGALGLKAIREAGGWTIAQDDRSALVYGMPKAALEMGACREVLPLGRIAERLAQLRASSNARLPDRGAR